jgi:hypothetical protein
MYIHVIHTFSLLPIHYLSQAGASIRRQSRDTAQALCRFSLLLVVVNYPVLSHMLKGIEILQLRRYPVIPSWILALSSGLFRVLPPTRSFLLSRLLYTRYGLCRTQKWAPGTHVLWCYSGYFVLHSSTRTNRPQKPMRHSFIRSSQQTCPTGSS